MAEYKNIFCNSTGHFKSLRINFSENLSKSAVNVCKLAEISQIENIKYWKMFQIQTIWKRLGRFYENCLQTQIFSAN